ncbi:UDP-N-acetylglucosamine transferase subunit ALG13 homolog [Aplysia californica]|uniref:UDP-N-acetylglucosamine transferase subunit ALG13 n=1 Tax=Aplysia californica TaxID=6500 RepID=A0ABM0JH89_APLCA|nr:UDP-N-acetylglucosamine transferase subunit ALG13 homolog [Aplysia californica]
MGKTIFVTVGTTQFDSLIKKITSEEALETLAALGYSQLTAQIGRGEYEPSESTSRTNGHPAVSVSWFRLKASIEDDIAASDLVVSHAGAGSVMDCLGLGKPVLVVVNEELMGNHQTELAHKLAKDGHLHFCGVKDLVVSLKSLDWSCLTPFPPGEPAKVARFLDSALGFV